MRIEHVRNFLFAVGQAVSGFENCFAVFGDEHRARKFVRSNTFVELRSQRGQGRVLTHAWQSKLRGSRNHPKIQLLDVVRFCGVHFKHASGKRVGIALFDDASKLVGRGFFRLLEIKAAGHPAKSQLPVNLPGARGIVLLEKVEKPGALAGIKRLEPGCKLVPGGRIGKLRLRGRTQKRCRTQRDSK